MELRLGFRTKLMAIVIIAALAFVVLIFAGELTARQAEHELTNIQEHYLPRVELGPQLNARFEHLRQTFQDAVAAHDLEVLADTQVKKGQLLDQLQAAQGALDPAQVAGLRSSVNDYYTLAHDVSRRLIAGETGEGLVIAMSSMQKQQSRVVEQLTKATAFDRAELAAAFSAAGRSQAAAGTSRLVISVVCLIVVLFLSLWIGGDLLRNLSVLAAGLKRFGRGEFAEPIPILSRDELGDVAQQANQMALSLARLGEERNVTDWVKGGQAGLAEEIRGELALSDLARRATGYIARHVEAPAAALYTVQPDSSLKLIAQHALAGEEASASEQVGAGAGLLGQAARLSEITVVKEPPKGYLRLHSGLGSSAPSALVFLPLLHTGRVIGVLELALFKPWATAASDFLLSIRETLAIGLEVARARERMRELLREKEQQAEQLLTQEDALRLANVELQARQSALRQQAEELTAASAYKSQFLANMSHELRTPLNAIIGFSELLQDGVIGPGHERYQESLGYILKSGRHLLKLINDVLDLSKVESGKLEFNPEPVDLSNIVDEMLGVLRTTAAARQVALESTIDPALKSVVLDPSRFKQVLYNYVSNALKFSPKGGRVLIRATLQGANDFRLEVEDSGVGISPQDLSRLFVEFQQAGTPTQRQGGTGLGLALTKRLVEAQGGSVGVRSTLGLGSVFHAVLPRSAAISPSQRLPPVGVVHLGARSILVVEDEATDRAALVEALANEGYSVEVATTGAQALALCKARLFDAITLDLLLPDMNGLDVLQRLRDDERTRDTPVIVITLMGERGLVTGFSVSDILSKPVDGTALLATLRRAKVSPERPGSILVVDDDPGSRELMATTLTGLGYQATCEPDGESALRAVARMPPKAVVLDLMMPGMNGFDFLARFRHEPNCRRVPVIVWTMKQLSAEETALLRATAQAIVPKGGTGLTDVLDELRAFLPAKNAEVASDGR